MLPNSYFFLIATFVAVGIVIPREKCLSFRMSLRDGIGGGVTPLEKKCEFH